MENDERDDVKNQRPDEPGGDKDKNKEEKKNVFDYFSGGDDSSRGKGPSGGPRRPRNSIALVVFVVLLSLFAFSFFNDERLASQPVAYSDFLNLVESRRVREVRIQDSTMVLFTLTSGEQYSTRIPYFDSGLLDVLKDSGAQVTGTVRQVSIFEVILQYLPLIIIVVFSWMMWRQLSAGTGGKMMSGLGKNLAKEYKKSDNKTTFVDVAGQEEAKQELEEVVDFLKDPARFQKIGARIPRGVLLVGPPGTGKTLLAKAVAGEAGVTFFHTSGSDFVEMFVGMGAARVRDLFEQGRKNAPCILFIDELDAVGRTRGGGLGGGNDEREQTLNQMLVEMDGFGTTTGVIVMAATNRPDVLDPALLRPGRFDRQVTVALPDVVEREAILKIHAKKIQLDPHVDLLRIARATPGSSGADLANLINEAALFAARKKKLTVDMQDLEDARDKILLGVARTSRYMTDDEKKATAYHEAGHALLHYYLENTDPLHKVTIIPHGQALGLTMSLPIKEAYTKNRASLTDWIKVCMGGYVAEEIIYGQTTTGTSNDIKQATDVARRMVTEWGMSPLGFVSYGREDEPLFLGREIAQRKDYSEATAKKIDEQVNKILDDCLKETRSLLTGHRDHLDKLTEALMEKETLDDAQVRELLGFPAVESVTKFV